MAFRRFVVFLIACLVAPVAVLASPASAQSEDTASVFVSCLSGRGRVDVAVVNTTATEAVGSVSIGGLTRSLGTLPRDGFGRAVVSGRPDGPYLVETRLDGYVVDEQWVDVDCQRSPAAVTVTCLSGSGRIDTNFVNDSDSESTFAVTVSGLRAVSRTVAPFWWGRVSRTGRVDGPYTVTVVRDGQTILTEEVIVACDSQVASTGPEVTVLNTCLRGRGYFFFQFANPTDNSAKYTASVSTVSDRSRTAASFGAATTAVSGRRDGVYDVTVFRNDDVVVFDTDLVVGCQSGTNTLGVSRGLQSGEEWLEIVTACQTNDLGYLHVQLYNHSPAPAFFELRIDGSGLRTRTIAGLGTSLITLRNRGDSMQLFTLDRDGVRVAERYAGVNCDPTPTSFAARDSAGKLILDSAGNPIEAVDASNFGNECAVLQRGAVLLEPGQWYDETHYADVFDHDDDEIYAYTWVPWNWELFGTGMVGPIGGLGGNFRLEPFRPIANTTVKTTAPVYFDNLKARPSELYARDVGRPSSGGGSFQAIFVQGDGPAATDSVSAYKIVEVDVRRSNLGAQLGVPWVEPPCYFWGQVHSSRVSSHDLAWEWWGDDVEALIDSWEQSLIELGELGVSFVPGYDCYQIMTNIYSRGLEGDKGWLTVVGCAADLALLGIAEDVVSAGAAGARINIGAKVRSAEEFGFVASVSEVRIKEDLIDRMHSAVATNPRAASCLASLLGTGGGLRVNTAAAVSVASADDSCNDLAKIAKRLADTPRYKTQFETASSGFTADQLRILASFVDEGRQASFIADSADVLRWHAASRGQSGLAASGLINPIDVRYTQDSVSSAFRDGGSVDDLIAGLRSGSVSASDVPPIRIVERDGKIFTLDNRRLYAFKRAGVDVLYTVADEGEVAAEWVRKFTTDTDGASIRIRRG